MTAPHTETMTKLEPCPFCGGEAVYRHPGFSNSPVVCSGCQAMTLGSGAWNRRASPPLAQGMVERAVEYFKALGWSPATIDEAEVTALAALLTSVQNETREEDAKWFDAEAARNAVEPGATTWDRQMAARDKVMCERYAAAIRAKSGE